MSTPYYQDDLVTLYHGDCTEVTEWLAADVLVTDPPYGMSHRSGWRPRPIAGDQTTDARDRALALWGDGSPAMVFGRWTETRPASARVRIVWDKGEWPGMGDLKLPWGPSDEEIYIIGEGWVGQREGTVIRSNRLTGNAFDHPTPKPVSLMERLISKCPPGIVADPFAGSGSTLVAAANLHRRAIGVEMEERYCEMIVKRLAQGSLFGDAS